MTTPPGRDPAPRGTASRMIGELRRRTAQPLADRVRSAGGPRYHALALAAYAACAVVTAAFYAALAAALPDLGIAGTALRAARTAACLGAAVEAVGLAMLCRHQIRFARREREDPLTVRDPFYREGRSGEALSAYGLMMLGSVATLVLQGSPALLMPIGAAIAAAVAARAGSNALMAAAILLAGCDRSGKGRRGRAGGRWRREASTGPWYPAGGA